MKIDLIIPSSLHWEIGNGFSTIFKRKKIDFTQAEKTIEFYRMIPLKLVEIDFY